MLEEMIIYVSGCLWASMAIVDANKRAIRSRLEGAEGAGLDLALVLKQVVCLNNSHGELPSDVLPQVLVP